MHSRAWMSVQVLWMRDFRDDNATSQLVLDRLRSVFQADRSPDYPAPLGVAMTFQRYDSNLGRVVAAVAGCRYLSLSLLVVAPASVPAQHLVSSMQHHRALIRLDLVDCHAAVMDAMLQIVSTACVNLASLACDTPTSKPGASTDTIASIMCSIAKMHKLQCLSLDVRAEFPDEEIAAPVLRLPRLGYCRLESMSFSPESLSGMLRVLGSRTQPLQALVLRYARLSPERDIGARLLFSPALGIPVLRHLCWLSLDRNFIPDADHADAFLSQVLPQLTNLRHLELYSNHAFADRFVPAVRYPDRLFRLVGAWTSRKPFAATVDPALLPRLREVDSGMLAGVTTLPQMLAHWPQLCHLDLISTNVAGEDLVEGLKLVPQLRHLRLPMLIPRTAFLALCTDVLPGMSRLHTLNLHQNPGVVDDEVLTALETAIVRLSALATLMLDFRAEYFWILGRILRSHRPFSLACLRVWSKARCYLIAPLSVMRAAAIVSCFNRFGRPSGLELRQYYQPTERSAVHAPIVASLYSLAATSVLFYWPPDQPLGPVPASLQRQALLADLVPCHQCGVYRRVAESVLSVYRDATVVGEVVRCVACSVTRPARPWPERARVLSSYRVLG